MSLKYVNPEALNENIVKTKEHVETVKQGLDSAKQNKMQFSTMPTASADNLGLIVIYTGATSGSYTHGYVYECVSDGQDPATYSWVETPVQDEVAVDGTTITRDQSTGQLSAVPATNSSKGIVQHGDGTEIGVDGEINVVDRLVVTATMPVASESLLNATRLFIGTSATYRTGGIYQCQSDGEATPTYSWVLISTAEVDLSDYKKTFLGTTAEWNAKTTAQKVEFDEADLSDDLGGGMVVSTVPAEGDHNPIESEAVYNLEQDVEANAAAITDLANVYGAKNLLNHSIESGEQSGLTITVNADRSITVSGTASANLVYTLWNEHNLDPSKQYILSGCPSGGSDSKYELTYTDGGYNHYDDIGSGVKFIPFTTGNDKIFLYIFSGQTFNNAVFKPMLRLASIADGTYEPYALTNQQLTEEHDSVNSEIGDIFNMYGAKNLVPFDLETMKSINTDGTWNGNVFTKNGVDWTVNNDGTISVSGAVTSGNTASSIKVFNSNANLPFLNKTLIMSGCPDGGRSDNTTLYKMMLYRITTASGSSGTIEIYNSNDSGSFVWRNDASGTKGYMSLSVYEAAGTVDLLFKPMLRMATVKDNTFVPYAMSNKELTDNVNDVTYEIADIVNVYGSKNLNKYPYYSTTLTKNGLKFTDLGDGRIKVNGTATGTVNFVLQEQAKDSLFLEADTDYLGSLKVISGSASKGSGTQPYFRYERYHGHTSGGYKDIKFSSSYEEVSFNTRDGNTNIGCYLSAYSGNTFTDFIIAPMIRKASIKDTTWVPYSKTNLQLTEDTVSWDNLSEFGAVNLLDNILATTTKNGLTATVNSDKSVTVTASSYPFTVSTDTYFALQTVTPTGVHKLSGCPNTGDSKIYIYVRNNSGGYIYDYGEGGIGSFGGTGCNIVFMSGAVVTEELTFYPMITDPSYNGSYVPHAKTNRELTESIATTNTNIDRIKKGTLDIDAIELTANTPTKVISSYGVYLITFTHGGAAPGGLYLAQVHATDVNGMQVAVIKESTDRTVTFDKSVVNQLTVTASGNGRMRIIKLDASNY